MGLISGNFVHLVSIFGLNVQCTDDRGSYRQIIYRQKLDTVECGVDLNCWYFRNMGDTLQCLVAKLSVFVLPLHICKLIIVVFVNVKKKWKIAELSSSILLVKSCCSDGRGSRRWSSHENSIAESRACVVTVTTVNIVVLPINLILQELRQQTFGQPIIMFLKMIWHRTNGLCNQVFWPIKYQQEQLAIGSNHSKARYCTASSQLSRHFYQRT